MIVAVTGARGMLGSDVTVEMVNRGHEVVPLGRDDLDITNIYKVKKLFKQQRPDIVINCAAYTHVDGAEENRETAMSVNALGARNLALACEQNGSALVQISTDYVFDGLKDGPYTIFDVPAPLNVYGLSKLAGEKFIKSLMHRYYIVRTSWLFGTGGNNFIEKILSSCKAGKDPAVVMDQVGSPTYTVDLARMLADLIHTGCYGTYHITNRGFTSWYGLAREITNLKYPGATVKPIKTAHLHSIARRPENSALDLYPLMETLGYLPSSWEDALFRYLSCREEMER